MGPPQLCPPVCSDMDCTWSRRILKPCCSPGPWRAWAIASLCCPCLCVGHDLVILCMYLRIARLQLDSPVRTG